MYLARHTSFEPIASSLRCFSVILILRFTRSSVDVSELAVTLRRIGASLRVIDLSDPKLSEFYG